MQRKFPEELLEILRNGAVSRAPPKRKEVFMMVRGGFFEWLERENETFRREENICEVYYQSEAIMKK
jgi:hypothetical protein